MQSKDQTGQDGASWSLAAAEAKLIGFYQTRNATFPPELREAFDAPAESLAPNGKYSKQSDLELYASLESSCKTLGSSLTLPDHGKKIVEELVRLITECRYREWVRSKKPDEQVNRATCAGPQHAPGPSPPLHGTTRLPSLARVTGQTLGHRQLAAAARGACFQRPIPGPITRPDGLPEAAPTQGVEGTCCDCSAPLGHSNQPVCSKCHHKQEAVYKSVTAPGPRRNPPGFYERTDVQAPHLKVGMTTRAETAGGAAGGAARGKGGRHSRLADLKTNTFYGTGGAGSSGRLDLRPSMRLATDAAAAANGDAGLLSNAGPQANRSRAAVQKPEQRQPPPQEQQQQAGARRRLSDEEFQPGAPRRQGRQRRSAPVAMEKLDLPLQEPINLADSSDEDAPILDGMEEPGAAAGTGLSAGDAAGPGPSSAAVATAAAAAGGAGASGMTTRRAAARAGVHAAKDFRSLAEKLAGLTCSLPPGGGKHGVEVAAENLARLEKGEFLNDTCIDFYIKFLEHHLPEDRRGRYHFFNTFFLKKLQEKPQPVAGAVKAKKGEPRGALDHERVKKWTKHVDLFSKDYIFVPIHGGLHWSLVLICHPGNVPQRAAARKGHDEALEKLSPNWDKLGSPLMLHLDSRDGTHAPNSYFTALRQYLHHEWHKRAQDTEHDSVPRRWADRYRTAGKEVPTMTFDSHVLPGISLTARLPQQDNHTDCGLFLLSYMDFFTAANPVCIVQQGSNAKDIHAMSPQADAARPDTFLQKAWFRKANAGRLRDHLRALICQLLLERMAPDDPRRGTAEGVVNEYSQRTTTTRYLKPTEYLEHMADLANEPKPQDDDVLFSDDTSDSEGHVEDPADVLHSPRAMTRAAARAAGMRPSEVGPLQPQLGPTAKRRKVAAGAAEAGAGAGGSQLAVVDLASPEKAPPPPSAEGVAGMTQGPLSWDACPTDDGRAAADAAAAAPAIVTSTEGESAATAAAMAGDRMEEEQEMGTQPGPSTQPRRQESPELGEEGDVEMVTVGDDVAGEGEEDVAAGANHDRGGTALPPAKRPKVVAQQPCPAAGAPSAQPRPAGAAPAQPPAPSGAILDDLEEGADGEKAFPFADPAVQLTAASTAPTAAAWQVAGKANGAHAAAGGAATAAAPPAVGVPGAGSEAAVGAGGGFGGGSGGPLGVREEDSSDTDVLPRRHGRRGAGRTKRTRLAASVPTAAAADSGGGGKGVGAMPVVAAATAPPPLLQRHQQRGPPREIENSPDDSGSRDDDTDGDNDADDDPERLPGKGRKAAPPPPLGADAASLRHNIYAGKESGKLKRAPSAAEGRPRPTDAAARAPAGMAAAPGAASEAGLRAGPQVEAGTTGGSPDWAHPPPPGAGAGTDPLTFYGLSFGGLVPGSHDGGVDGGDDGDHQPEGDLGMGGGERLDGDDGRDDHCHERPPHHGLDHQKHDHHRRHRKRHRHRDHDHDQQLPPPPASQQPPSASPGQAPASAGHVNGGGGTARGPSDYHPPLAAAPLPSAAMRTPVAAVEPPAPRYRTHLRYSDAGNVDHEERVPIPPSEGSTQPPSYDASRKPPPQQCQQGPEAGPSGGVSAAPVGTVAAALWGGNPIGAFPPRAGQSAVVYGLQYGMEDVEGDNGDDIGTNLEYVASGEKAPPLPAYTGAGRAAAAAAAGAADAAVALASAQEQSEPQQHPHPPPRSHGQTHGHGHHHDSHGSHHHHHHGRRHHQHSRGGTRNTQADGRPQQDQGPKQHSRHSHHHHDRRSHEQQDEKQHQHQPREQDAEAVAPGSSHLHHQEQQQQQQAGDGAVAALDVSDVAPPRPGSFVKEVAAAPAAAATAASTVALPYGGVTGGTSSTAVGQRRATSHDPRPTMGPPCVGALNSAPPLFGQQPGEPWPPQPAIPAAAAWGSRGVGEQGTRRKQQPPPSPKDPGAGLNAEVFKPVEEDEYNYMVEKTNRMLGGPSIPIVSRPKEPWTAAFGALPPSSSSAAPTAAAAGSPPEAAQAVPASVAVGAAASRNQGQKPAAPWQGMPLRSQEPPKPRLVRPGANGGAVPPAKDIIRGKLNSAKQQVASWYPGEAHVGSSARVPSAVPQSPHQPLAQAQPPAATPPPAVNMVPPPEAESDDTDAEQPPSYLLGAAATETMRQAVQASQQQAPPPQQQQQQKRERPGMFLAHFVQTTEGIIKHGFQTTEGMIKHGLQHVKDFVARSVTPPAPHQPHQPQRQQVGSPAAGDGAGVEAAAAGSLGDPLERQPRSPPPVAARAGAEGSVGDTLPGRSQGPNSQAPLHLELAGPSSPGISTVPPYTTEHTNFLFGDASDGSGAAAEVVAGHSGCSRGPGEGDARGGGGVGRSPGRRAGEGQGPGARRSPQQGSESIDLASSDDGEDAEEVHAGGPAAGVQQQPQLQWGAGSQTADPIDVQWLTSPGAEAAAGDGGRRPPPPHQQQHQPASTRAGSPWTAGGAGTAVMQGRSSGGASAAGASSTPSSDAAQAPAAGAERPQVPTTAAKGAPVALPARTAGTPAMYVAPAATLPGAAVLKPVPGEGATRCGDEPINISDDDDDDDDDDQDAATTAAAATAGQGHGFAGTDKGPFGVGRAAAPASPQPATAMAPRVPPSGAQKGTADAGAGAEAASHDEDDVIIADSGPEDGGGARGRGGAGSYDDDDNDDQEFVSQGAASSRKASRTRSQSQRARERPADERSRMMSPLQQQHQAATRALVTAAAASAAAAAAAGGLERGRRTSFAAGTPAGAGAAGFGPGVQPQSAARNLQSSAGGRGGGTVPLSLNSGKGGGGGAVNGVKGPQEQAVRRGGAAGGGSGGRARGPGGGGGGGSRSASRGTQSPRKGGGRTGAKNDLAVKEQTTLPEIFKNAHKQSNPLLTEYPRHTQQQQQRLMGPDPFDIEVSEDDHQEPAPGARTAAGASRARK